MRLTTARLVLRELVEGDWRVTSQYEADPEVVRYTSHGVQTPAQSLERVRASVAAAQVVPRVVYDFGIERAGALLGRCGVKRGADPRLAELWFILRREAWGQGVATEAVREVLRFAFEALTLHRVAGECDPRNLGSARVMEKAGLRREGHLRQNLFEQGAWVDTLVYAALEVDWRAQRGLG